MLLRLSRQQNKQMLSVAIFWRFKKDEQDEERLLCMRGSRGGIGVQTPPLENHKLYVFFIEISIWYPP